MEPIDGPGYERPEDAKVRAFQRILIEKGYGDGACHQGLDIDAACGQLGERPDDDIEFEEEGDL